MVTAREGPADGPSAGASDVRAEVLREVYALLNRPGRSLWAFKIPALVFLLSCVANALAVWRFAVGDTGGMIGYLLVMSLGQLAWLALARASAWTPDDPLPGSK